MELERHSQKPQDAATLRLRCTKCQKPTTRFWCKICEDSGPCRQYFCSKQCQQEGWEQHKERCRMRTKELHGTSIINWDALNSMRGTPALDWNLNMSIVAPSKGVGQKLPILMCKDKNNTLFNTSFCLFEMRHPFVEVLSRATSITWKNPSLEQYSTTCLILDRHVRDITLYDREQRIDIPPARPRIQFSSLANRSYSTEPLSP